MRVSGIGPYWGFVIIEIVSISYGSQVKSLSISISLSRFFLIVDSAYKLVPKFYDVKK